MAIKVSVLFFGATASEMGRRQVEITLPEGTTSADVFSQLTSEYPRLNRHKLLFAINQNYSSGKEMISEGDELAVFTAVSGG